MKTIKKKVITLCMMVFVGACAVAADDKSAAAADTIDDNTAVVIKTPTHYTAMGSVNEYRKRLEQGIKEGIKLPFSVEEMIKHYKEDLKKALELKKKLESQKKE